jgi:hypothetical protein
VQALNTLIESDGHTPAVAGFFDKAKPLTAAQVKMIQEAAARRSEATAKQQLGVEHWVHDTNWLDSLVLLEVKNAENWKLRWQPIPDYGWMTGNSEASGPKTRTVHLVKPEISAVMLLNSIFCNELHRSETANGCPVLPKHGIDLLSPFNSDCYFPVLAAINTRRCLCTLPSQALANVL